MSKLLDNLKDYKDLLSAPDLDKLLGELSVSDLLDNWHELEDEEPLRIFTALSIDKKVELINSLPHSDQEHLIQAISAKNAKIIMEEMELDDLVDFIQSLSPKVREQIWSNLSEDVKKDALYLLKFDEDDAAGLMNPKFLAIRSSLSIGQALNWVRRNSKDIELVYYIFVIDDRKRLNGVISLHQILASKDSDFVEDVMVKNVVSVREDTDQEEVAKILEAHDFLALPVVDFYNRLLGIVTVDDVIDVIREEQTEDIYKMGAMAGGTDSYMETSIIGLVKKRIPWLSILLIAATFTTNVLARFESLFTMTVLVLFIPTIIGTGGNSGTQSATLMIRGLATGEIKLKFFWSIMAKEFCVGIIMGLAMALLIILRSLILPPEVPFMAAIAVGLSLGGVIIVATLVGTMMPLLISKLGFDPTVMAGPFMATIIDLSGLTIYFVMARLILGM